MIRLGGGGGNIEKVGMAVELVDNCVIHAYVCVIGTLEERSLSLFLSHTIAHDSSGSHESERHQQSK